MTDSPTRACEIQKAKMLERLAREVEQMREASVVDLSKLFPRRDERERVEETW